jgi:hypothetical protein
MRARSGCGDAALLLSQGRGLARNILTSEEDGRLGSLLALRQNVWWSQLAENSQAEEQDEEVIQLSNHRDERWNELDRTHQVAHGAARDQLGMPRYARVSQSQREGARVPQDALEILFSLGRLESVGAAVTRSSCFVIGFPSAEGGIGDSC